MPFDREQMKAAAATLARESVFIGTSSWKYPGWRGQLYDADRYVWHGKFSEARFERLCLAEYAEVFKSVCVDAAYYTFPSEKYLDGLAAQVPSDFQFGFKVTDEITVRKFPNLPRFGVRAGSIPGGTAIQENHRWRWPAIEGQGTKQGINASEAGDIGQTRRRVRTQVIPGIRQRSEKVGR